MPVEAGFLFPGTGAENRLAASLTPAGRQSGGRPGICPRLAYTCENKRRAVPRYPSPCMQTSDIKTQILSHSPTVTPGAAQNIADTLAARYEVLDPLGAGGMGMVYRVRDRETTEILA